MKGGTIFYILITTLLGIWVIGEHPALSKVVHNNVIAVKETSPSSETTEDLPETENVQSNHPKVSEITEAREDKIMTTHTEYSMEYTETTAPSASPCQLVPLMVNLTETVGEFILLPGTVDIGDCVGTCRRPENQITVHSYIKNKIFGSSAQSCCVPTNFVGVEVLIQVNGSFSIDRIESMKVTQCGCL